MTKKFLASIVLVLILVTVSLVVTLGISQKRALMRALEEKGKKTTRFLAAISAEPIMSENFRYLEGYVKDISQDRESGLCGHPGQTGQPPDPDRQRTGGKENLLEFIQPGHAGYRPGSALHASCSR